MYMASTTRRNYEKPHGSVLRLAFIRFVIFQRVKRHLDRSRRTCDLCSCLNYWIICTLAQPNCETTVSWAMLSLNCGAVIMGESTSNCRKFRCLKAGMPFACISFACLHWKDFLVTGLFVGFPKAKVSSQLNTFSRVQWVYATQEEKDNNRTAKMSPLVFQNAKKATGYIEKQVLTRVNTFYSQFLLECFSKFSKGRIYFRGCMLRLKKKVRKLNEKTIGLFEEHSNCALYMMKHLLLSHLCKCQDKLGTEYVLGSAGYKHFNAVL